MFTESQWALIMDGLDRVRDEGLTDGEWTEEQETDFCSIEARRFEVG